MYINNYKGNTRLHMEQSVEKGCIKMLSFNEKEYIRDLAKKQSELSRLPEMEEKTKLWYAHNACHAERPVFTIELGTFIKDLMPPPVCTSKEGQNMEWQIQQKLLTYEYLRDDQVIDDTFSLGYDSHFIPFHIELKRTNAASGNDKKSIGYQVEHIIEDLEKDFHKLKKSYSYVGKPVKDEFDILCEDTFGDILRVVYRSGFGMSLARQVFHMLGMEGLMYALYDYPDLVHKMMRMLTDDLLAHLKKMEDAGILVLNNDNTNVGMGSKGFTTELPASDFSSRDRVLWRDMWGHLDSQETVCISSEMFAEFFFPYYKEVGDQFGFLYYGCCEPVHDIWDNCLSKLDNLKKVSISPWCDEQFMGDILRGSKTIYHRKPRPNYLGVDKEFDEAGFRGHLLETIRAAKGCTLEFTYRDVYTLCGDLYRSKRAYDVALDMFEKHWGK